MKRNIAIVLVCTAWFLFPMCAHAQLFHRKLNRWENNLREGLWIEYYDTTNQIQMNRGRYHLGIQTGKWKYYNEDGSVRKKERIGKEYIVTKYYHPNGKIKSKGKAVVDRTDPVYLHYYYHGPWIYYDEQGKPEYLIQYNRGDQVGQKKLLGK